MPLMAVVAFGNRALIAHQFAVYRQPGPDTLSATTPVPVVFEFVLALAVLALVLLVGALIDRTESHRLLATGGALTATGAAVIATASPDPLLFTGRLMVVSGFTVTGAAALAHVVRRTPERQRGRVLGLTSVASLAGSVSAQMAVEVAGTEGWRVGLLLTTLAALAGIAIARKYTTPIQPSRAPDFRLRHLVYTPNRLILVNLSAIAVIVPFTWSRVFLVDAAPDVGLVGLTSAAGQLVFVAVAVGAGALSDRVGRLRVLVPGALFAGVVSVLAYHAGDAVAYVLLMLSLNLASGTGLTIKLMVVDRAPPNRIGATLATYDFVRSAGLMMVSPMLGSVLNATPVNPAALSILPACAALVAVLAIAAGESAPSRRPREIET